MFWCTFCQIWDPIFKIRDFKGQNIPQRPQNWKTSKKSIKHISFIVFKYLIFVLWKILNFSNFVAGYILAFKISYFECGVQIWIKGTLKHLTRSYESIFEPTNFHVCNLVSLATRAAFLALKLKIKETCEIDNTK